MGGSVGGWVRIKRLDTDIALESWCESTVQKCTTTLDCLKRPSIFNARFAAGAQLLQPPLQHRDSRLGVARPGAVGRLAVGRGWLVGVGCMRVLQDGITTISMPTNQPTATNRRRPASLAVNVSQRVPHPLRAAAAAAFNLHAVFPRPLAARPLRPAGRRGRLGRRNVFLDKGEGQVFSVEFGEGFDDLGVGVGGGRGSGGRE